MNHSKVRRVVFAATMLVAAFLNIGSGQAQLPDDVPAVPVVDVARRVLPAGGDLPLMPPEQPDALRPPKVEDRPVELKPFGASLFEQQLLAARAQPINPDYRLASGDQVAIAIWGAWDFNAVLTIDLQGNIFVPEIGPIRVAGLRNADLDPTVRASIRNVFSENVQSYTNLLTSQPVSVFVTGGVERPGRYAGARVDSLLYYLAAAGGIAPGSGSYRQIVVLRGGKELARVDLYEFLVAGRLPIIQFTDNDTIVVGSQGPTVSVEGEVRRSHIFEVAPDVTTGAHIAGIAAPMSSASHVAVQGIRDGQPYNAYLSVEEFAGLRVRDGDHYTFESDRVSGTIFVHIEGHSAGPSSMAVRRDARLRDVLDLIEVDPLRAAVNDVYLRRKSIAQRQDRALEVALQELQRSVLLAESSGPSESQIRVQEAQLVERFINQARAARSEGRVVLAGNSALRELRLEAGDEIVIPTLSDVVLLSGEVRIPQSVQHVSGWSVSDYVKLAGGLTERAETSRYVVLRQNGAAEIASNPEIRPGDQVLVLPAPSSKGLAVFRDIIEIMYRVAVSGGVLINAFD